MRCLKLLRRNLSSVYHDLLETIQLSCISIFLWSSSTYNQNLYSPSSSQRTFALDVLLLASKLVNSSENFILLLPVFGCNLIQRSRIKTKVSLQNRPYYFLAFFRRRNIGKRLAGMECKTGTSVRQNFIQLFRERLSQKMRTRQSRKEIWDMINTLFLTL